MTLKTYKPYTKSTRGTIILDRTGLWKGKPVKSLTSGINGSYGRNNLGRITSRLINVIDYWMREAFKAGAQAAANNYEVNALEQFEAFDIKRNYPL
jgi:ribosomal protein L2